MDTSSPPIALTSHRSDCHSIPKAHAALLYLCSVYLSKTKKQKNQAGTKQTARNAESLTPVLPSDMAPAMAISMRSQSTGIASGRHKQTWWWTSYGVQDTPLPAQTQHRTPAYPLSAVLGTPNCSQSLSRSIFDLFPRTPPRHPWHLQIVQSLYSCSTKQRGSDGK